MLLSLYCSVVIMLYCYCVALLLFVLSYVLIVCTVPLPPGVNPIAVDKYININTLGESVHTVEKNAEALVFASREISLDAVLPKLSTVQLHSSGSWLSELPWPVG